MKGIDAGFAKELAVVSDKIEGYIVANNDKADETERRYKSVRLILLLMILASFGIILVIAWLIVRRVTISLS